MFAIILRVLFLLTIFAMKISEPLYDAQMYSKINEYEKYYIALLQINLYDTTKAKEFYTKLHLEGGYRFIYDEEAGHHWFVKLYNKRLLLQKILMMLHR